LNGEVIATITKKHMSSERAAQLILIAGANRISEASLSQTPLPLLFAYAFNFFPDLTYRGYFWLLAMLHLRAEDDRASGYVEQRHLPDESFHDGTVHQKQRPQQSDILSIPAFVA
uniref:ANK_REP_REGION domain-containing protein n=1 Tax=Toxocara canis TaxID=6265 RepID=A0A183U0E1_TOXCA